MNAPSHSINAELVLQQLNSKVEIKKDDMRAFSVGPDILIAPDWNTFEIQHQQKSCEFFLTLMDLIKENKLYDNSEVMAFLYGQVSHFVSDVITHPMIYYMTEGLKKEHKIDPHGMLEYYLDDYYMNKYGATEYFYYKKTHIDSPELIQMITELYSEVYDLKHEGIKYDLGVLLTLMYHILFRRNLVNIPITTIKLVNLGDVLYHDNGDLAIPYMNMNHEEWTHPVTGEKRYESFDDLFNKAVEETLDTIDDVM